MSPLVQTTICFFCFGLGIFAVNSTTSLDYEEFPEEICLYAVVNTSFNKAVAVGCTQTCLNGSHINRPDNTSCINKTVKEVEAMQTYENFSCIVGHCKNGTCVSLVNSTTCEKPPVMWA
ncbi:evasin P1243-like [Rhipicephalus microplus]|uniref:evasin P1243-like n=1 Tax=Rhipicephalus microplus TaxID=6941 RepID=UPI003F6D33BA